MAKRYRHDGQRTITLIEILRIKIVPSPHGTQSSECKVDDDAVLTIRLLGDAKGDGRAVVRRELMLPASKVRMRALDQN